MDPIDRIWLNLMVMFLGGIIIIGMEKAFFSPAMIQQSIVYCRGDHQGMRTTISGFANLSHRYVCRDGTTEEDRGETESVPDPKSTPFIKLF
jgi:hypothetical protein